MCLKQATEKKPNSICLLEGSPAFQHCWDTTPPPSHHKVTSQGPGLETPLTVGWCFLPKRPIAATVLRGKDSKFRTRGTKKKKKNDRNTRVNAALGGNSQLPLLITASEEHRDKLSGTSEAGLSEAHSAHRDKQWIP